MAALSRNVLGNVLCNVMCYVLCYIVGHVVIVTKHIGKSALYREFHDFRA